KMFKTVKPVIDSFGIIQPVDRKNDLLVVKVFFNTGTNANYSFINTGIPEFFIIDTNWKLIDLHHPASIVHRIELAFYLQYHFSRLNEMLHIIMRMKSNKVGAHHSLHQLFFPFSRQ